MTPLLTPDDVADLLGVSKSLLTQWRVDGVGPAFIRQGRVIRYRSTDVIAWVDKATVRTR